MRRRSRRSPRSAAGCGSERVDMPCHGGSRSGVNYASAATDVDQPPPQASRQAVHAVADLFRADDLEGADGPSLLQEHDRAYERDVVPFGEALPAPVVQVGAEALDPVDACGGDANADGANDRPRDSSRDVRRERTREAVDVAWPY